MFRRSIALPFVLMLALALPARTVTACPMCSEAIPASSGHEEEDQARLSRAYNSSIYLMVGVPYFLLGSIGFMVYRHLRVRDGNGTPFREAGSL